MKRLVPVACVLALAACASGPKKPESPAVAGHGHGKATAPQAVGQAPVDPKCTGVSPYAAAKEDPRTRGDYVAGGLYKPGVSDTTPEYVPNVACIPEPLVVHEARSAYGNRTPYTVLGKRYHVMDRTDGYVEQGTASYYGAKFHGRRTSNQEVYDMYAFTAAHKSLPLPSFARVTNLDNGESVVVRVNDRGPFHEGRVIDLSYAAAVKLGITQRGTGRVEVRALLPGDQPQVASVPRSSASVAKPSDMDKLVNELPASLGVPAAVVAPVAASAAIITSPLVDPRDPNRYRVVPQHGQPVSADRFDAWLSARGLRVVGDRIVPIDSPAPVASTTPAVAAAAQEGKRSSRRSRAAASAPSVVSAPPPATATVVATAPVPVPAAAGAPSPAHDVWLQVASFSSRENADKALARLQAAGITTASLSDIQNDGRRLWRLRVGAPDAATASELAGRIDGLGLGRPQIVRE